MASAQVHQASQFNRQSLMAVQPTFVTKATHAIRKLNAPSFSARPLKPIVGRLIRTKATAVKTKYVLAKKLFSELGKTRGRGVGVRRLGLSSVQTDRVALSFSAVRREDDSRWVLVRRRDEHPGNFAFGATGHAQPTLIGTGTSSSPDTRTSAHSNAWLGSSTD
jgi:hypothetical protein